MSPFPKLSIMKILIEKRVVLVVLRVFFGIDAFLPVSKLRMNIVFVVILPFLVTWAFSTRFLYL